MTTTRPTASPATRRKARAPRSTPRLVAAASETTYILRLYVSRFTLKSIRAVENMKRVCAEHLHGRYRLEVIDIQQHANLARDEQIVAVPTLIKRLPPPLRRLVGDMSDLDKVLLGLDLRTRG